MKGIHVRTPLRWVLLLTVLSLVQAPALAQTSPSPFASLRYRAIGPAIAGGRTTAIEGSDRDALLYYAGGADGGVFKSTDGGASWHAVFDTQAAAAIGAIAISPANTNDVWVGTGESNPRNDVEEGNGIWHSTDGGAHWTHLGLDDSGAISRISIDPRDPRTVAVAVLGHIFRDGTERGVYVTHDAGAHWTRTLYVGPSTGASDLVRIPGRPSTLYAGLYQFRRQAWTMTSGGTESGIYRSDDNGRSWRKLTSDGLPAVPLGRIGLAAGSGGRMYAIVQSKEGDLWRSDDGGATWHLMPHSSYVGARPFYFSRVYVDPADANRLISVGLILSMSTDGGGTFHAMATNGGWDYHYAWWSGDGRRVAVGSDEGVVISADGGRGAVWQPYDLPFAQPYHVGFDNGVPYYHVCIGLQDDNSWCGPSSSDNGIGVLNRDWFQVAPGDGMWSLYDPKDPNLVWSTSTNSGTGQVWLTNVRTRQQYEVSPDSENNGQNPASALKYRFNWITPVAFTNDGKALIGGNVLFESADHGQTWTVISPDLTRNEKAKQQVPGGPVSSDMSGAEIYNTILDVATSPLSDGLMWVSTDDGLVQLTRDGGTHWTNVTPKGLPEGRIPTIEPGHGSAGTAYIAMDRHMSGDDRPYIFVTDDYGANWKPIAANLPSDLFVRAIREDPKNHNVLYAGTQRGVWISFDRGTTWQSLRLNMPASAIYDLEIQPNANDLLVAVHGRGVWILDDLRPLQEWTQTQASSFTLYQPRDANRIFHVSPVNVFTGQTLPANEFIGENASYGAIFTYNLPKAGATASIDILDAQGRIVRHLTGKDVAHQAGMNRASWDIAEDGPVRWLGTFEENRGPKEGAESVPGTYTVRVIVDGASQEKTFAVKADPRDPATQAELQQRHDALAQLNGEVSGVDTMLNQIDERLKNADPSTAATLRAFQARLTYVPKNVEDLQGPPGLRIGLLDLIGRISGPSFQAPTASQTEQMRAYRATYEQLSNDFDHLPK